MLRIFVPRRTFSCITFRSKLFAPTKKDTSLGKLDMARYGRLLLKGGYVHQTEPGMYSFLPLGQRVVDEMQTVIDEHLDAVGAQKMQMPILQNTNRWEQTGRREKMGRELYTLKDRKDQEYCLSPTNEEVITSVVKDLVAPSEYPMILYQCSQKFRDEKRIYSGIMRSKEFLMLDAYSFDKTMEEASVSFENMGHCFDDIFKDLEIPVEVLDADNGVMGGSKSREYQCLCGVGQDQVAQCTKCGHKSLYNPENGTHCLQCGARDNSGNSLSTLEISPSLELGHMFLLGDRYSQPLNLTTSSGPVMMGCYGLGVSRMVGTLFQLYGYQSGVLFPNKITTYDVVLVNAGRTENTRKCAIDLLDALGDTSTIRILFDDRDHLSLGARLKDAELAGARLAIIIGKQYEKDNTIDLRLLHKSLLQDVLLHRETPSGDVGEIHPALREKVEGFDIQRLEQLGFDLLRVNESGKNGEDGFTIHSGFSNLYWNLIQALSCVKVYSSKPITI